MYADLADTRRYYRFLSEVLAHHIRTIKKLRPGSKAFIEPLSTGYAGADSAGTYITEIIGWGLGEEPVTDTELDHALALYDTVGFSPKVELSPYADETLMKRLEDRGFRLIGWIAASARPVREGDLHPVLPEGITFRKAEESELEVWSKLIALGFADLDKGEIDENTLDIGRAAFTHPWTVPFLAEIEGEPAGASAVAIKNGIGYMATASTLPKFRKRGIQTGMVLIRIAEAARQGATEVLHQSSLNSSSNRNALSSGMEIRTVSAYLERV